MSKLLCRIFGHGFDDVDLMIFNIVRSGRANFRNEVTCRRCKQIFSDRSSVKEFTERERAIYEQGLEDGLAINKRNYKRQTIPHPPTK